MKKLLIVSLFLLLMLGLCNSANALITTDNVDRDAFQYEVTYSFATRDVGASKTGVELYTIPIPSASTATMEDGIKYRVVSRGSTATYQGRIVGMSVYMGQTCTAGSATFDVTINGNATGIQAVVDSDTARSATGITGSTGTQYSYIRHDRTQDSVEQGFRQERAIDSTTYNSADNYYGRATPLVAGDRIGVKMTTSSSFTPTDSDVVITVYVLE